MATGDINFAGAESGDSSELDSASGASIAQSSVVRTGTYSYNLDGALLVTGAISATGASAGIGRSTETFISFWARKDTQWESGGANTVLLTAANAATGGNSLCVVRVDSSGNIVEALSSTTLMAAPSLGEWHHYAFRLTQNALSYLSVDGGAEASFFCGNFTLNYVRMTAESGVGAYYVDDIVIGTTAAPSGAKVATVGVPIGAGNYTNWTGGTPFQQVDEVPHDSGTTTIASGTTAGTRRSSFDMSSCSTMGVTSDTIHAVKALAIMSEVSSTTTLGGVFLRHSTTDSDTTAADLGTTAWVSRSKLFTTCPSDSAAWNRTKVDASEVGVYRSTSDTSDIQATAIYALVLWEEPATRTPRLPLLGVG